MPAGGSNTVRLRRLDRMVIAHGPLPDTQRRAMPRLIHLNGPSGVGKSPLARRYADEHPGTLVLDLDVLAGLIGGWERNFSGALEVARGHGREMAARHLRDGYDVVLPQLVTVHGRVDDPALEEAAQMADATYIEVAPDRRPGARRSYGHVCPAGGSRRLIGGRRRCGCRYSPPAPVMR